MSRTQSTRHYLSELASACEHIAEEAGKKFLVLGEEELNWKPAPDSWSIAQCLEHLVITNKAYYDTMRTTMHNAQLLSASADKPFKPTLMGRMMVRMLRPDNRIKIPTVKAMTPAHSTLPPAIVQKFVEVQRELPELLREAQNIDINSVMVHSPFSRLVRFNLGDAFGVIVTHAQRHLGQAARVMQQQDFPQ